MGHRRISVCACAYAYAPANANSDAVSYIDANGNSFSHGNPDALSSNRSGLCRRENYGCADHLAERRIHYGGNHGWAAGA